MKVVLSSVSFATPYTPQLRFLSLGYLHASALSDEVVAANTEIVHNYFDPSLRNAEQIADAILAEAPDVVGFTCYVWNAPDNFRICEVLKAKKPELVIILGGPEVSYHYNRLLEQHDFIDYIGVGEGEHTFREFLRALVDGDTAGLTKIAGLAQRQNGKPVLPSPRAYEKDLDLLPSPYLTGVLDACDIRGGVNYQTARGCPFVCTYCDYGRNQPYFEFSMERVRAEFDLFKKWEARILFNTDPTFNYSRKRAEAILQLGIELDIQAIHWFEVFPTLVNDDLVELVKDSHMSFIGCGIQTCNPTTMRNIRRVWRPEKIAPVLDKLSYKKNIMLSYEIIMGLPGDDVQAYKDTMSWTYARQPADIKSFNLAILPRTPLEREVADKKWGIEYDPDVGHEILSTDSMDRHQVLIGKAINDWHRLLQNVFFRLTKLIDEPAGELVEQWAWCVYDGGFHNQIPDLQVHRIPEDLVEGLAGLFETFVAGLCQKQGVPDLSGQFRDLLRYHFYRRSRTWASAFFADVRDIYFNEPYPELHRYYRAREADLVAPDGEVGGLVPVLGGNVDQQYFHFDMDALYPVTEVDGYAAVLPSRMDYLFFMTPDTGAGCAISVDDTTRKFVELVDGKRTVDEIADAMGEVGATAPRIFATLEKAGLFDRPRFLTEFEEGSVAWQSCFPEIYRAYH